MDNSQNKSLVRVVDDISSVNDDKIKSLLMALNTRGLQGVDCIPWVFFISAASGDSGQTMIGQVSDVDSYEFFPAYDDFNISLSGCIKISTSVVIPPGFATSLSWSVDINFPEPLPNIVVTFTTLAGITNQTSLDAWYVDFLAACELAGIDTSVWFGEPVSFGPSYLPLTPDEMTFFLWAGEVQDISFVITAVVEEESSGEIIPNSLAECRYNTVTPGLYPGRRENLYVGRLTISFPAYGIQPAADDDYKYIAIRDYVLYNKGLIQSVGGVTINPNVFVFYGSYSNVDPSDSYCLVLENVVFSRVGLVGNYLSNNIGNPLYVNFSGYKISNVP